MVGVGARINEKFPVRRMIRARSTASAQSAVRYFGDSRCRSIWNWQLILALTAVTIAAGVALLTPDLFANWRFSGGLFMIIAITTMSLGIPWHRIGSSGVLVVPLLDALAIGLLDSGTNPPVAFLWVFPVAWVASYYAVYAFVGILSLISALTLIRLFENGITPEETINVVVLLITLSFVGMIMSVGSQRTRSSMRLLQGQSARIGNALRRVTEQKARNQRLIDSVDVGIARVGPGGIVEIANRAFHALYGYDGTASFHPTSAVEYRARRGTPIPLSETTLARASRGELFADELVWVFGLDGQWRALKAFTRAVDEGHTTNDGVLLLIADVTESIDPRASRDATRRTISHELRNPLTAILGHVDLLLEHDEFNPSTLRQLQVVERAANRMQRLIDDALGTAPAAPDEAATDFNLADIASASIEGFAPVANAAGVTLDVRLHEELLLSGDEFRLRQVVDNVIGNAIKYAQRGGKVAVRAMHPNPNEAALVVTDTGIGISEADLPRIFEPEFRTKLARERGIPGTGLGLGISRDIVVDQGGRLEVTSELGQGTEVTVAFPLRQERKPT